LAKTHTVSISGYRVTTISSGAPWHQNCHLIGSQTSGSLLIVDPGAESAELDAAIRVSGLRPGLILLTHGHPDHLGAAASLMREFGLVSHVARKDQRLIRHASAYAAAFGKLKVTPPEKVTYLDAEREIWFGEEMVAVMPVPGHTPGSLAFLLDGVLITGDTLFRERIGRTDLPGGDASALVASVDALLAAVPGSTQILPGHGRPWTVEEAKSWWSGVGRPRSAVGRS
jgi:hydroxyacylglutathione hydrolase